MSSEPNGISSRNGLSALGSQSYAILTLGIINSGFGSANITFIYLCFKHAAYLNGNF
jgi:hypothetical protein